MRKLVIGAALLAAVLALIGVWRLRARPALPAPPPPRVTSAWSRAMERRFAELHDDPLFRSRLGGLPEGEAQAALMAQAERGFARLDDAALVERVRLLSRMFEAADVDTCGAAARGKASPEQRERLAASLDPASAEAWVELSFAAARAELAAVPYPPAAPPQRVQMALGSLLATLPPDDADRLRAGMPNLLDLPDADACWVVRTLYAKVAALDPAQAAPLARLLARP
jgi:hypothetical protein